MWDTDTLVSQDRHPDSIDNTVMRMLAAGLPLALLCDLTDPDMPSSREIYGREGSPEVEWWAAG